MYKRLTVIKSIVLVGGVLSCNCLLSTAFDQSAVAQANTEQHRSPQAAVQVPSAASSPKPAVSPFAARSGQPGRARLTYKVLWGIDRVRVSEVSSGAFLRFSYRVLDASKAKALHDERSTPYLIDEKTGAVLQVPNMPKVGELRPKITPVNGNEYWMVFSNKGFVKPGSRVDVVIGLFRADGVVVE